MANEMLEVPVRQRESFLVFGAPDIQNDEIQEVVDSLQSGWLGTGQKVAQFEEDFRNYKKAGHCVAVGSGTAALHLALLASGVGPGDEVITTALTFCATVNAIMHAGATPVLVDVDLLTMNLDPDQVEYRITPRTRAILPVHFAGYPCDMRALCNIADRHGLKLIEDCAHAIETEYQGGGSGTFGDFGCFSFYVTKNVVTGEGGMLLTKREEDAARAKVLALHGMSHDAWGRFSDHGYKHYDVVDVGFKYNMMDLQAAIGIHQLRRIESGWRRRQQIWERYNEAFKSLPVTRPIATPVGIRHSYHLYTMLVDPMRCEIERDEFLEAMTDQNIGVGVHYRSIPEHSVYKKTFGWKLEDYPRAAAIGRQTVSIPLSPRLTDEDVEDVIAAVTSALNR